MLKFELEQTEKHLTSDCYVGKISDFQVARNHNPKPCT